MAVAQPSCLLTPDGECFGVDAGIGPKLLKFFPIRHEFFQGKILLGSKLAAAATHQAAVLRHLIEPHQEGFGTVEFGQVWNRLQQYLLRGVFGVLTLAANAHTKGEHCILEQSQGLLQSRIVTPVQELHGLFDLRPHRFECSTLSLGFTNCRNPSSLLASVA